MINKTSVVFLAALLGLALGAAACNLRTPGAFEVLASRLAQSQPKITETYQDVSAFRYYQHYQLTFLFGKASLVAWVSCESQECTVYQLWLVDQDGKPTAIIGAAPQVLKLATIKHVKEFREAKKKAEADALEAERKQAALKVYNFLRQTEKAK